MTESQERSLQFTIKRTSAIAAGVFLLMATARCKHAGPQGSASTNAATLRVGVGQIQVAQLIQNLTVEPLIKIGEDGRIKPWLADSWQLSADGLSLVLELKRDVHFHDGSPLTAQVVIQVLRQSLPQTMGAVYEDITSIEAKSDNQIVFTLKRPSAFLLEGLDGAIQEPGVVGMGTGPFIPSAPGNTGELLANSKYHLGPPLIDRVAVIQYPSVRTAWAEMLRGHLDMVYELGVDERSSLESARSANVFTYVRHYQYIILLNPKTPALRSPALRRALNTAIDRAALLQDGLDGHGVASLGPVWPKHWAVDRNLPTFTYDPAAAARELAVLGKTRFKCLVASDDERIALVVKRQLEAVGVEMDVEESSIGHNLEAVKKGEFEAVLWAAVSGPSLFRPYFWWHSRGYFNWGYKSQSVDAALDAVRHSTNDSDYRKGLLRFQSAIVDDPPAIFLAWDERARAVTNRFEVPAEPGVDILGTLRMWRPVAGVQPGVN